MLVQMQGYVFLVLFAVTIEIVDYISIPLLPLKKADALELKV
jgi:hypothetical protein